MRIAQFKWSDVDGWSPRAPAATKEPVQWALVFGSPAALRGPAGDVVRAAFPDALLIGGSTAGEICAESVMDETLVVTTVTFAHAEVRGAHVAVKTMADSANAGGQLARGLPTEVSDAKGAKLPLVHVLVVSDGLHVNGSDLVRGLSEHLPADVTITGGLAGDGARFGETLVWGPDGPQPQLVAAVGFYGRRLKVGFGSLGGWDSFGPDRRVTRSRANVLFELDGQSALGLYKKYLGEHATGLPATGLLFPLSVRVDPGKPAVVRTILAVDESEQSLTFAGDVPEGSIARLMKANFDRLIDGAAGAAAISGTNPDLALLISCVGRKLVLRQRVEEEVESVREVLGAGAVLTGFYSYGEISPFTPGARCELHNQTMTITTFTET
jgi:hypothetical protein